MSHASENREVASQYPVELLQTFLENQSKELGLRTQELELAKQQGLYSFEYSKFSTEVQSKNLEAERKHQRELIKMVVRYGFFSIILLTIVVCLALYLGKEQFVLEIVKLIVYGGCGAIAGLSYQKNKQQVSKDNDKDDVI